MKNSKVMAAVLCLLMTGGTALAANETLNSQTLGQVQAVAGATKAKAASAVKAFTVSTWIRRNMKKR